MGNFALEPGDVRLDLRGHLQQHGSSAPVGQRLGEATALFGARPHVGDDWGILFGHAPENSPRLIAFQPFHCRP